MSAVAPLLRLSSVDVQLGRHRIGTNGGPRRILAGVNLDISYGEIVGVIGETGSGKTTLARTIAGVLSPTAGSIEFDHRELTRLSKKERRTFRRSGALQLILQDPLRSLDPDLRVGEIVAEGLTIRGGSTLQERAERVATTLGLVGLDPEIASRHPGEISGGQRQRVSIARSLIVQPKLLICDEPVSALDASTRNYLLSILADIRRELGLALLVISHDLASLAGLADRVAVLFRGRIVEEGPIDEVFNRPQHPYTALLVSSAPTLSRGWSDFGLRRASLRPPANRPTDSDVETSGCVYRARCPFADAACAESEPSLVTRDGGHAVACVHAGEWSSRVLIATVP